MKAVSMNDIVVSFPGILANDHVNMDVEKGSIHCLLGENGSGKSTLMNVLFGLYHKDEGKIEINGKEVEINSPSDAENLGIGMVHQHFMLIPQLTVLENIILGSEPGKVTIDKKKARQIVSDLVEKYSFNLNLDKKINDISVGMRQKVEILKLLYRGAEILIFDEPTAVLTPQEVSELFEIFRILVGQGCTIIFITHKLDEIFNVSDRVTILRKGKSIASMDTKDLDAVSISQMMIGRQLETIKELDKTEKGDKILEFENVTLLEGKGQVSFSLRTGEILGVAGIDGNGQIELEELVTGVRKNKDGVIKILDQNANELSVDKRRRQGLAYIPSDRAQSGVLPNASVKENFLLGHQNRTRYSKKGFVDFKALEQDAAEYKESFDIKFVSLDQQFGSLSGGNQQKVVLSREVTKDVSLVLAAQPIRGLDISAIEFVHNSLLSLRKEGKGILLISAELSELMELSDRIIVLWDGKISREFTRDEFDEQKIGLAMIGEGGSNNG